LSDRVFRYRPDVRAALRDHGVSPKGGTRPELVHEFVSDLYRFEIRRLRERLLAKEFPKIEYASRVVALRMRYRVISMRARDWLEPQSST
jgi:hypothetical protein